MRRLLSITLTILLLPAFAFAATQTINTLPSANDTFMSDLQTFLEDEDAARAAYYSNSTRVISGGIGATDASLSHTISTVIAFVEGYYITDASISHTYTASKDTFVLLRKNTSSTVTIAGAAITYDGNFVFAEMANATDRPATPSGTIFLFEAVTDGASITTVNDLRQLSDDHGLYFVDPDESNHGAAGDGRSVKDIIDAVGSTREVTLVFRAYGYGDTTTYTFDDDETIPVNFTLQIENGAVISVESGDTLTIANAGQIVAAPIQRIFSGDGTVTFTDGGEGYANWFTDDGVGTSGDPWTGPSSGGGIFEAFTANLNEVKLLGGYYKIESAQTEASNGARLHGINKQESIITYALTTGDIMTFSGKDVTVQNVYIWGPGTGGSERALVISDSRSKVDNITIYSVGTGLVQEAEKCHFGNSRILQVGNDALVYESKATQAGAATLQNVYLLQASQGTGNGIAFAANLTQLSIINSNIEKFGKGIYSALVGGSGGYYGVNHLTIINSHFEENDVDIDADTSLNTCFIAQSRLGGNTSNTTTTSLDFSGATRAQLTIDGGVINSATTNHLNIASSGFARILNKPTGWDSSAVTGDVSYDPIIFRDNTAVSTSGGGGDDLISITIASDSYFKPFHLDSVTHITACGTKTDTDNDAKDIDFYFGSTAIELIGDSQTADDWRAEITVYNINALDSQGISWVAYDGTTVTQGYDTASEDTSGSITIKFVGQNDDPDGDPDIITQTGMDIEIH